VLALGPASPPDERQDELEHEPEDDVEQIHDELLHADRTGRRCATDLQRFGRRGR
jgi:hypothetical protein